MCVLSAGLHKLNLCLGTIRRQKYVPDSIVYVFMLKEVFIIKIYSINVISQLHDADLVEMCLRDANFARCAWEPGSWILRIVEVCLSDELGQANFLPDGLAHG